MADDRRGGLKTRCTIVLALASLVLSCSIACDSREAQPDLSLERVRQSGKLVIGIDPSYPPFESYDDKGQLVGFDVDLAGDLAARLDVQPDFVTVDVGGIMDALIARKVDVVISSLAPYPEYAKQVSYSQAYFNAGQVLVVSEGSAGIDGLEDLKGKVVTLESGSEADLEMSKRAKSIEGLTIRPVMTAEQALTEVREGRADAAVVDAISALEYLKSRGGLYIAGNLLTDEPFVIAARRKDQALLKEIDRILSELRDEGSLELLQEKWL